MKRILLLSNMFPHASNVASGVFVEKMMYQLIDDDQLNVDLCVLRPQRYKLVAYLSFYLRAFWSMLVGRNYILYCHFVSHTGLLALIGRYLFCQKVVLNCHGSDIVIPAKTGGYVHKLNAITLRCADKVVVPSSFFAQLVHEKFGLARERLFVYPSGGVFYPSTLESSSHGWPKDPITFGYVGSLSLAKGFQIITKSMNKIDFRCRLLVAGPGDIKLIRSIKNLNVEVVYCGVLNREKLNQLYTEIDFLLFPTLLEESLGLTPIEAMAFGVPVVASKIGAVTEYIADRKNGFFIEPGSVDDMTNALMRIADLTATEYASLRSCARIVAAEYDENKIVKEYRSVFQKVCHDGKA
jgi:glycosyltransferase involved in cell wall biosynthesis